jgi:N,N'-diacetyl-8-epilegionaminate cytidylyltransferase
MPSKNLIAFIFARGGSKGVKNKNIRLAGGKPLIAYAIECGLSSRYIGRVVVSTDSAEIAQTAKKYDADILMRPPELAADDTPEMLAWRHAIKSMPDVFRDGGQKLFMFISMPATSPFRRPEDIDAGIQRLSRGDCDVVFGIAPSRSNPHFTMVTVGGTTSYIYAFRDRRP